DDELAVGMEELGQERVERVVAARAVTVHDDDLGGARSLRAADGRVDLLGVQPAPFLEERAVAAGLPPLAVACAPFDPTDHVSPPGRPLLRCARGFPASPGGACSSPDPRAG